MIIACYAVFNEEKLIANSIASVKGFVNKIVVVDGSWTEKQASQDNTLKIVEYLSEMLPIEIIHAKKWRTEAEKREEYVVGNDGDIYLILDADELLFCGGEWIREIERGCMKEERCFNVVIWNKNCLNVLHQRIYRHPFSYIDNFPTAKYTVPLVIAHHQ